MNKILKLLSVCMFAVCITACGKDDEPDNPSNSNDEELTGIAAQLVGTTWSLQKSTSKKANGSNFTDYLSINPNAKGQTITFLSDKQYHGYKLHCSYVPNGYATWCPSSMANQPGDIFIGGNYSLSASDAGTLYAIFGSGPLYVSISGDVMTLRNAGDSEYQREYVYYRESGSNNGGGSSNDYETPDVEFYDYTQTGRTTMKVDFIIYNKDDIGSIKSVKVSYGKSSSASGNTASANVVGTHVIANLSGLSTNTDYYVKCTVNSDGGSYTTGATRIRLTEW